MAKRTKKAGGANDHSATIGYEAQLWGMADALRGGMAAITRRLVAA